MNVQPELVKITNIVKLTPAPILGFSIDNPKINGTSNSYTVTINGWILGKNVPVATILLLNRNEIIRRVPVNLERPDIAKIYPDIPQAQTCGFSMIISTLGMADNVELQLQALLHNKVDLGSISLQRTAKLRCDHKSILQPLMVTSLGRSGSTWLMRVLAENSNIIIHREYPYETHAAKYWIYSLFKVLSEPTNYLNPDAPAKHLSGLNIKWVRRNLLQDNLFSQWFINSYIEQVVKFCKTSTDSFYTQVASHQNQTINPAEITYFAEKFGPWESISDLCYELYPQTKEIILVRDFRDMLCSMLKFSEQRGVTDFGLNAKTNNLQAVKQIKNESQRILSYWQQRTEHAFLVHYEDLVLNPAETFLTILDYLGLEANAKIVKIMLKNSATDTKELKEHRTSKTPKQSIGRWQQDLSEPMKELCAEYLTEELTAFGYDKLPNIS